MENNRSITICTAAGRKSNVLQAWPTDIQEFFGRLQQSQTLPYTHDAYTGLKKAQQDDLKDIGAYIAGTLKDGRRKAGSCISRCAAVLDADNLPTGSTEDFIRRVAGVGVCCCIHSTAKHSPASPRLRVVVPFSENIPAEQYAPTVRLLCQLIQPEMSWFDPSTDQAGRIMYWASHCQDVAPVHYAQDGNGLLDVKGLLTSASFNWKDIAAWPQFPREQAPVKLGAKQADPAAKEGLVGAFCRCYDIPAAMDEFLPGVYEETATPGRYTFSGGSTWGGAVAYENGKFLYSNHATDPAGGQLCNAWDLVRLHLFSDLDDEAKPGTRGISLPSFKAMDDLARKDTAVMDLFDRERANAAFSTTAPADEDAALAFGRCAGENLSLDVLRLALKAMGAQIKRNLITGRVEISGMPAAYSQEEAINTLPLLLLDKLHAVGVKGSNLTAIRSYMAGVADESRFNPVLDMLHGTQWDGINRLPELLSIIHVEKDSFYALLIRKWLIQCVALAHNGPGRQDAAEGVLTLQGEQGIGKTMLLRKLSIKSEWFAEGVTLDLKNKDDVLRAIGVWITELGELDSTLKKEQSSLKSFITQKMDKVRAPYAAESVDRLRHTSFGATVNPNQFLKDDTGDRRFWVVPVETIDIDRLLALPEAWFVQLWAEVYIWWVLDSQGFRLSPTERDHLNELNREYREDLQGEAEILQEFNYDLPVEQWGEYTPAALKKAHFCFDRLTAQQIGRVLVKLSKEDDRITVAENKHTKSKTYRLPVQKCVSAVL